MIEPAAPPRSGRLCRDFESKQRIKALARRAGFLGSGDGGLMLFVDPSHRLDDFVERMGAVVVAFLSLGS